MNMENAKNIKWNAQHWCDIVDGFLKLFLTEVLHETVSTFFQ